MELVGKRLECRILRNIKNPNNKFYKVPELMSLEISPVVCMCPPTELAWAMSGLRKQIPTSASNN